MKICDHTNKEMLWPIFNIEIITLKNSYSCSQPLLTIQSYVKSYNKEEVQHTELLSTSYARMGYFLLCQSSQVRKIAICNAVRVKAYRVQDVGISPDMKPHEVYHQKMNNKTTARLVCLLGGFKVYIIAFILYLYTKGVPWSYVQILLDVSKMNMLE